MMLSDRIAVIYEGSFMGIVPTSQANEELLGLMMSGSMPESDHLNWRMQSAKNKD